MTLPVSFHRRCFSIASSVAFATLLAILMLADCRTAAAIPLPGSNLHAIPAFARKYGMPCSACHEAWPKLNFFGQSFKDNGYQLGNDRDAPIFQNPAYWPATFRMTPQWHRDNVNRVAVDDPTTPGGTVERSITNHGFDWSGLDFHTAGTLAKNFSFYVLPSSDNTGAFHFESVWGRVDNIGGSPWLNIKLGKFELDNLLSEKRILTLTSVSGVYTNYHFQPATETFGTQLAIPFVFGIGDNQAGLEVMGHSKNDRTRYSVSLLSGDDGSPGITNTGRGYDGFFTFYQAFQMGRLGLQRVGAFSLIGQSPTFFQYTSNGQGIAGTGIGNKGFYRNGLFSEFFIERFDLTAMYFHSGDSAYLATGTAANTPLPTGAREAVWNGGLFEATYMYNPQITLIGRYELVRMEQQALPINAAAAFTPGVSVPGEGFGNMDVWTVGYRYYPFINSRAGFAFHNEYAVSRQRGVSPSGLDLNFSSLLFGFDFDF